MSGWAPGPPETWASRQGTMIEGVRVVAKFNTYHAIVRDEYGRELWDDRIDATDELGAREAAVEEYHAYVESAYEPGHYKAAAVLAEPVRVEVRRVA